MTDNSYRQLGQLRNLISQHYNQADVGHLCATMGFEFEHLPGESKLQKVNSLLNRCTRNGQLEQLVNELGLHKPQVAWPTPANPEQVNGKTLGSVHSKGELKSTLQRYLEEVKQRLLEADLQGKPAGDETFHQVSALVRESFSRLDALRKRRLLEFLHDEAFISRRMPLLTLRDIDLNHVDLSWINLSQSHLRFISLTGADLSLAKLGGSDLSGSNLRGASLRAYLVGAELVKSDLRESDLSGALLANTSLAGANLRFANLQGADLQGANLTGADLRYANFQDANLSGVNLSFTSLTQVNLKGAIMKGAIFHNTDFRENVVD